MQSYSQLTLFCQDFITELQKNVGSQFHKRFAIYKKKMVKELLEHSVSHLRLWELKGFIYRSEEDCRGVFCQLIIIYPHKTELTTHKRNYSWRSYLPLYIAQTFIM